MTWKKLQSLMAFFEDKEGFEYEGEIKAPEMPNKVERVCNIQTDRELIWAWRNNE